MVKTIEKSIELIKIDEEDIIKGKDIKNVVKILESRYLVSQKGNINEEVYKTIIEQTTNLVEHIGSCYPYLKGDSKLPKKIVLIF